MENILEKELHAYFVQLNDAEKKSVLLMLKTFLSGRGKEDIGNISIEQYNKDIDEALAEVTEGKFISQAEMEKQADKW
ncbi:MAG: hypothetical protein KGM16_18095 [Bacteroidota bacterium]|nr:hypothetical protein [Bacteroidota bacterium]